MYHKYLQTYAHTCIYALFLYIGQNINCSSGLDLWINVYPVSAAHFPWFTFFNNKTKNYLLIKKKGIIYECTSGYKYGLVAWSNSGFMEDHVPTRILYPDIHPKMKPYYLYLYLFQNMTITMLHTFYFLMT